MNLKNSEKKEKSIVELTIEVSGDEFKKAVSDAYYKQRGKVTIPGFRKGKAPRNIIEHLYGESFFWEDAVNISYPAAYDAAVKEAGLEPVGNATMEVSEINADGYTFVAKVPVMPEVSVEDYKGIEAVKIPVNVEESEIDSTIENMRRRNARIESVDRAAQNGDTAVIDFEGFVDGVAFAGGKGEQYSLELGSGSFIPGFEDQIVGHSAGEEIDVNVTFPTEYHAEDLAGKDAVFKVKIHEVKESILPELDDEFAKDVSEFDTLAEFRADMLKKMTESREADSKAMFENSVLEKLAEKVKADIPDAMIDAEAESMVENLAFRMSQQGMSFDTYTKITGMTAEQLMVEQRPQAEMRVRIQLGLDKIAEIEKLEVTDEELDAEYKKIAEQYNMDVEKVKMSMSEKLMREDILRSKANDLVCAAAVATEPAKPEEKAEQEKTED